MASGVLHGYSNYCDKCQQYFQINIEASFNLEAEDI